MVRCAESIKLALVLALLPVMGGCGVLRLNEGREFAIYSAGYAGRFHLAFGRWPDANELEEFVCMRGRAGRFDLAQISCDELVRIPYLMQISPRGTFLEMRIEDLEKNPVCTLRVLEPPPRNDEDLFPMIVIKTNVFSCRGNGGAWRSYGYGEATQ